VIPFLVPLFPFRRQTSKFTRGQPMALAIDVTSPAKLHAGIEFFHIN